jgi:hypothetical protein
VCLAPGCANCANSFCWAKPHVLTFLHPILVCRVTYRWSCSNTSLITIPIWFLVIGIGSNSSNPPHKITHPTLV